METEGKSRKHEPERGNLALTAGVTIATNTLFTQKLCKQNILKS